MTSKPGNPQVEDGYTRVSNELLMAFSIAMSRGIITSRERAIIDYVIRYTYGYHKKNGYFHNNEVSKYFNFDRRNTSRLIRSLIEKKIIEKKDDQLGINKHYEEWGIVINSDDKKKIECHQQRRQVSSTATTSVINSDDKVSSTVTTKSDPLYIYSLNIYKDNKDIIKKEKINTSELTTLEKLKKIKFYPFDIKKDLLLVRGIKSLRKITEAELLDTTDNFILYCDGKYKSKKNKNPRLTYKNFFRNFPIRKVEKKGGFHDVHGNAIQ